MHKLRWFLNKLVKKGVDKVALEASSHGLVQNRLNGIKMPTGANNLSEIIMIITKILIHISMLKLSYLRNWNENGGSHCC